MPTVHPQRDFASMDITWHLETRKLSELKENPHNPRTISRQDFAKLKDNIQRYGIIDKPCINTDNQLIGGHQRKRVFRQLGIKSIEVWVPSRELTSDELKKLNVVLNKVGGEFDFDILAGLFEGQDLLELGFKESELFDILEPSGEKTPLADDDNQISSLLIKFNSPTDLLLAEKKILPIIQEHGATCKKHLPEK